ncbi:Druantia anti-phage system protein DruA [Haloarcula nitratireducens]|uniref:DUF4338 domain-containing protein n=1 Tax=Haloarcula nitratireducens TaxID=2487749 RepID=A0AAW4PGG9_9EURY|nr:Druantia anti-phage system protein DruA [Halomicroarcula nitratireducens]MBX0297531.1 DUF4338 domain-containing protein [Halomicroarcula nitratireducens]
MAQVYDESSVHLLQPDLTEEYLKDLDRLCDRICQSPNDTETVISAKINDIEDNIPENPPKYDQERMETYNERIKYLAVLEALHDLVEIGYHVEKNPNEIDGFPPVRLHSPDPGRFSDDPQAYKEHEREILQKERRTQFDDESVRRFIREMETPDRQNGEQVDVTDLIADGEALYQDLAPLSELEREEIIDELDTTIRPYVQHAERGIEDEHTGLDLHDIWRYFRYTWLTPYNQVPGRNINFLIRDAARDHHPIIGIASLASSMMNLRARDKHIGWRIDAVQEELKRKQRTLEIEEQLPKEERTPEKQTRTREITDYLETKSEWQERIDEYCSMLRSAVETAIDESINQVRYDDFIGWFEDLSEEDFQIASDTAFKRLKQLEGLGTYVFKEKPPLVSEVDNPENHENVFDPSEFGLTPGQLEDINIKDKDPESLDSWEEKSETALFVKKRAHNLQKLLRDREYFLENDIEDDQKFIETSLESDRGERALRTALKEIKKRRVGAGMMNIQVCGAIPPYNHILGGKLVAMALTGPKVINHYREKYEGYKSKIASSMKGEPIIKNNELVFLDTTGLFQVGSAQYDRVRVPTPGGKIEYEEIGKTSGYGSVQFGPSARKRLAQVTEMLENRKAVKGRFGEGIAPKMRKIRRGLENLKLDGELLKHESPRVIYAVPLASDFREFLFGLRDEPNYFWPFEDPEAEQQEIYDHWKQRWVSKRVQKEWVLEDIRGFEKDEDLRLGHEVDFQNHSLTDF